MGVGTMRGDATSRPSWVGSDRQTEFRNNYDKIKWGTSTTANVRIIKGKARGESTTARKLYIKETVEACRTPMAKRGDNFERIFPK